MCSIADKSSNVLHYRLVDNHTNLDAISGERMMRREGGVGGVALLHALEPWLVLPAVNLSVIVIVGDNDDHDIYVNGDDDADATNIVCWG